ncbi:MAG: SCO family protein [Marmoricola sp.]
MSAVVDRRLRPGLIGAIAAAVLLTGCGGSGGGGPVSGISTPDNHGFHGTYLGSAAYPMSTTELTDTAGRSVSLASSSAPVKLVFFGYSHCPDICQVVMSTIASALIRLDAAQRAAVQVTFVTTDPARDTRSVLRAYLDRFNSTFVGLTGPLARISEAGKPLHVFVEKGQKLASGGYEVDHSTYVYGAVGNRTQVIWNQATSPAEMRADIIKLLKQKETA